MKRRTAVLVALLALATPLSCAPKPDLKARLGLSPWPGYAAVYLAEHLGYFSAEGLDVQVVEQSSAGDSRRSFERGELDLMCTSNVDIFFARENSGRSAPIIWVTDWSNGSDMLLARGTIGDLAGLRGRRIALEMGTLDVVAVGAALETAGLAWSDVTPVNMPQAEIPEALLSGSVDAAETYPPMSLKVLGKPGFRKLFDSSRAPGAIVDVVSASSALLESRPEVAPRVLRAIERATKWMRAHRDSAETIVAARQGVSVAELREGIAGLRWVDPEEQADWLRQGGRIDSMLTRTEAALVGSGSLAAAGGIAGLRDERPLVAARVPR